MFTNAITRIAATAVAALVVGGSGTAALVACTGTKATADVDLSAKAEADLSAAQSANDQAVAAVAEGSADAQAKADALMETSTAKLEQASAEMHAAVDAGSRTAIDGIADFTAKTVRLVNGLAVTANAGVDASVQASARLASAVDHQVAAARSVVGAQGEAALKALGQLQVSPPPVPGSASVSTNVSSSTSASAPPANVVSSTTGSLGISLGK